MKLRYFSFLPMIVLAGCTSIENPGKRIPALSQATRPAYTVGDTYLYSDGYVEEVVSIQPHHITWALGPAGVLVTRSSNFFDPTIQWKLDNITYKADLSSRSGSLWPMHEGIDETLHAQITVEHKNGNQTFDQRWTCSVPQSERIQLRSGGFDTFVVECQRQSESGAHWQRRRFNYAPEIGHYVRVIEEMKAHGYPGYVFKQRDLVYFQNKKSQEFISKFQTALTTVVSGHSFSLTDNGHVYKFELLSTSTNTENLLCRTLRVEDAFQALSKAQYCLQSGYWAIRTLSFDAAQKN